MGYWGAGGGFNLVLDVGKEMGVSWFLWTGIGYWVLWY